jgi:hypothetical protein
MTPNGRKPFPGMLPAFVVSEALRRPDGGGQGGFGGHGLGRLYETSVHVERCR